MSQKLKNQENVLRNKGAKSGPPSKAGTPHEEPGEEAVRPAAELPETAIEGEAAAVVENGKGQNLQPVHLDSISLDAGTESRQLNETVVADYQQLWQQGVKFPPIVIYTDSKQNFLADGLHRVHSAKLAGILEIEADVYAGSRLDALKYALQANQEHGHRRSIEDKRYAVSKALKEFAGSSDREIATMCGVSHTFVGGLRPKDDGATGNVASSEAVRKGKDGKLRRASSRKGKKAKAKAGNSAGAPSDQEEPHRGVNEAPADGSDSQAAPLSYSERWYGVEKYLYAQVQLVPEDWRTEFGADLRKFADLNCH